MSWIGTAVSIIGFGFAIVQFFERLQQMPGARPATYPTAPRDLGLALIGCGILSMIISIWQYMCGIRYLWGGTFAPIAGVTAEGKHTSVIAIAILLPGIGLFAFCAALFRIV